MKGKVVVVEPANAKLKARLEAAVVKLGGKVEQNPTEGRTDCYVETGFKIKAKNVARSGKFDVAKSSWLLDCESEFRDAAVMHLEICFIHVHSNFQPHSMLSRMLFTVENKFTRESTTNILQVRETSGLRVHDGRDKGQVRGRVRRVWRWVHGHVDRSYAETLDGAREGARPRS